MLVTDPNRRAELEALLEDIRKWITAFKQRRKYQSKGDFDRAEIGPLRAMINLELALKEVLAL